jgi:hypothetical protein
MKNLKLIIAFFEAIKDNIFEVNPDLKYAIKYQLKIEELKIKITSKIGKRAGMFRIIHEDLIIQFSNGKSKTENSTTFLIKKDLSNFKEIRDAGTN